MAAKAKSATSSPGHIAKPKKRRPGVHTKSKTSNNKRSKNYRKQNVGQGR